ncbi:MAG TPA: DNA-3-methyladenine glycosylase I [Candidatus Nanopelagicales bacterium]|nr:DNA-3-methyladenine glycosylase I [Candidatus Nanopelagicales bacterium]
MSEVVVGDDGLARCAWGAAPEEYRRYHDEEWGRPAHGDRTVFEKLTLEAFQSGLSWLTILRKRENFRAAFDGFDPAKVAAYGPAETSRLLADAGIVRNRAKIGATLANAAAVVRLREAEGDGALDRLFWSHRPTHHRRPEDLASIPSSTSESAALARDLKRAGLVFVGPTTAYAAMQSLGVVDDHVAGCHRAGR